MILFFRDNPQQDEQPPLVTEDQVQKESTENAEWEDMEA
jgi:hypothetical protein